MQFLNLTVAIGLSVFPIAFAGPVQNGRTTTETWHGKPTTLTAADHTYTSPRVPTITVSAIHDHSSVHSDGGTRVFTETWDAHFTQDDGEVKTVPIKTVTLTYVDGTLANIPGTLATKTARDASYSAATGENPPETITNDDAEVSTFLTQTLTGAFQPAAVAKDHTSVSMWTETTTYTQTVAATTMNISGTPHTFTEWIQTITWTKLVTTHITVPDRIAYYTSPVPVDEPPFATVTTTGTPCFDHLAGAGCTPFPQ
ncbi:hypothetical protein BKA67DRAFT_690323 [Truncatella angustata]|uniref:Uncharacterized protein n=1 Tax=Truncatella angustata TaxID=152316 RepID=A0A9P8ZZX7_9PEZI|nr:uncharacterized protein BKA67DRAFT_690323 [Truncatella angustata]KAH6655540.1 hypothetical protein BKA67DRAFT_690323 [Truncatella angustata]